MYADFVPGGNDWKYALEGSNVLLEMKYGPYGLLIVVPLGNVNTVPLQHPHPADREPHQHADGHSVWL